MAPCTPRAQHKPGFPGAQVLCMTATNFAQAVMLTLPFTVAVFMVRQFLAARDGGAASEAEVGRLTGGLAAFYSFSQFTLSYAWGLWSNRFGRKPVMVLGSAASMVCLVWFGLAGSYAMAAAARIVAGLLNGIIVAWKCMVGETCDPLRQGVIMSYMSLAWGLGCVAGPGIGGVLSQPCSKLWPGAWGCGEAGLLQTRPYLLPCAIAAAISCGSLLLNIFVLEETLPAIVEARNSKRLAMQQQQHQDSGVSGSGERKLHKGLAALVLQPAAALLQRTNSAASARYQRLLSFRSSGSSSSLLRSSSSLIRSWPSNGQLAGCACCQQQQEQQQAAGGGAGDGCSCISSSTCWCSCCDVVVDVAAADSSCSDASPLAAAARGRLAAALPRLPSHAAPPSSIQLGLLSKAAKAAPGAGCPADIEDQQQQGQEDPDSAWRLSSRRQPAGSSSSSSGSGIGSSEDEEKVATPAAAVAAARDNSGSREPWTEADDGPFGRQQQQPSGVWQAVKQALPLVGSSRHGNAAAAAGRPGSYKQLFGAGDSFSARQQVQLHSPGSSGGLGRPQQGGQQQEAAATGSATFVLDERDAEQQQLLASHHQQQPAAADGAGLQDQHSHHSDQAAQAGQPAAAAAVPDAPWYRDSQVVLAIVGYGLVCLIFCALDELIPIYASAPLSEGGLGLTEIQLAGPLAFGGLCLILFSLACYPRLQRSLGTLPLTRHGLLLAVLVALAIPAARFAVPAPFGAAAAGVSAPGAGGGAMLVPGSEPSAAASHIGAIHAAALPGAAAAAAAESGSSIGAAAWAVLYGSLLLKAASGCSAFTGAMILVNALAKPEQLGSVNGVGQSLASLARGIGPASAGLLWGATVEQLRLPGAQVLPYLLVAVVALVCCVVYCNVMPPEGVEAGSSRQPSGRAGAAGRRAAATSGDVELLGRGRAGAVAGTSCCQE